MYIYMIYTCCHMASHLSSHEALANFWCKCWWWHLTRGKDRSHPSAFAGNPYDQVIPGDTVSITLSPKYMDVSENSGTPKSSILTGFSIINHPFWGIPIFGNTHMLAGKRLRIIHTFYCCPMLLLGNANIHFSNTMFCFISTIIY